MISKKYFFLSIIALPLLFVAFFSTSGKTLASECNADADLQGSVTKNQATITNYSDSEDCVYDATLAIYDSPKAPETYGWIEAQTLIASKTVSVAAGQTVGVAVEGEGQSCWRQSDLIRGKDVWTPPTYRDAIDTDVYAVTCGGESTPTPTPTVSVTPSHSPTPGPTNTPTPEPTNTPAPGPTNTPTPEPTQSVLAGTGNIGFIYAVIFIAAASLIAGFILKRFSR